MARIGLILGTGTNASYLEEVEEVTTATLGEDSQPRHMVVLGTPTPPNSTPSSAIPPTPRIDPSPDSQHGVGSLW